jgi:Cd2+/Zn2+-exporting ATPase
MVMALYAIAELIEARSVDRARNAIKSLLDLTPDTAEVRRPMASGGSPCRAGNARRLRARQAWCANSARWPRHGGNERGQPGPGHRREHPGGQGRGRHGVRRHDQRNRHARIPGHGDLHQYDAGRIIHAVEQAQGTKAPTQRFVDRFAEIYTPSVFAIAVAVALLTPWLLGWNWSDALYKALVLLVIACPCALVIATPVTVVSGLAAAARRGILIKGGVYLEEARKLRAIALDKTGTITEGKPRLVATEVLSSAVPEARGVGVGRQSRRALRSSRLEGYRARTRAAREWPPGFRRASRDGASRHAPMANG